MAGNIGSSGFHVPPNSTSIAFYVAPFQGSSNGMVLFAADTDGRVQEYIYHASNGSWTRGFKFPQSDGFLGAVVRERPDTKATMGLFGNETGALALWGREGSMINSGQPNVTLPYDNPSPWGITPDYMLDDRRENSSLCGGFYQDRYQYIKNWEFDTGNVELAPSAQAGLHVPIVYERASETPAFNGTALGCVDTECNVCFLPSEW